jgi:hypothetical protein
MRRKRAKTNPVKTGELDLVPQCTARTNSSSDDVRNSISKLLGSISVDFKKCVIATTQPRFRTIITISSQE